MGKEGSKGVIAVVTMKGCKACEEVKEKLKGKEGVVFYEKDEIDPGILQELEIDEFPTYLHMEQTKEGILLCNLKNDKCIVVMEEKRGHSRMDKEPKEEKIMKYEAWLKVAKQFVPRKTWMLGYLQGRLDEAKDE